MEDKHRDLIKKNFDELVEKTHDLNKIVSILAEKLLLNHYMVKRVLHKYPDKKRQLTEFYDLIQGRGPSAFCDLCMALRATGNLQAEEILTCLKLSYYTQDTPPQIRNTNTPIPTIKDHGGENRVIHNGISAKDLIVQIHPQKRFMDIDAENQPSGVFRMRSKPRGCALIINIRKTPQMKDRLGSDVDVKNLMALFKQIGYYITHHYDLSKKDMKEVIKAFATNKTLSKVDSCIVFVMSHGNQPESAENVHVTTSDGQSISINWILNQFTFKNSTIVTSPNERKPKMFFFQACRVDPLKENVLNNRRNGTDVDSENCSSNPLDKRNMEDMFVVHSTVSGQYSLRDETTGSWFVQEFCKVVAENAWQYDLDAMLGMVDDKIRDKNDPTYGSQTTDVKKIGLSKKIYFNPGLYE